MTAADLINKTVGLEGNYSNSPSDKGGETMYGITKAVALAYGYTGDMKTMPRATALDIYMRAYWLAPKLDQVAAFSWPLAAKLFDIGVNQGQPTAGLFLQRSLNVLNYGGVFPNMAADGNIGAVTIAALKAYSGARGSEGLAVLLNMVRGLQTAHYVDIAEKNPSQEVYEYGWQLNRAMV